MKYGSLLLDEDGFVALLKDAGAASWLVETVKARKQRQWQLGVMSGVGYGTTLGLVTATSLFAPSALNGHGPGLGTQGFQILGISSLVSLVVTVGLTVYWGANSVHVGYPSFVDFTPADAARAMEEFNRASVPIKP